MEFKEKIDNGTCEAKVDGELTIYHVNEFKDSLQKVIKQSTAVMLDLSDVSEIDTSCIQVLMQAQNACHEDDKVFELSAVSPAVQEVVDLFGMTNRFARAS